MITLAEDDGLFAGTSSAFMGHTPPAGPRSPEAAMDLVLYGNCYETRDGRRIDPRDVIIKRPNTPTPRPDAELIRRAAGRIRVLELQLSEARKLAREVMTLNPTAGELGEGKARRLQELAQNILKEGR